MAETTTITAKNKKWFKVITKILGIFSKIGSVFCWIGVGGCVIGGLLGFSVLKNINLDSEAGNLTVFDQTIKYEFKEDGKFFVDGQEIANISNLPKKDYDEVKKILESDIDFGKLSVVVLVACMFGAVICGLAAIMLNAGAKVLKNFSNEDTPFTQENIELTHKVFIYSVISFILAIVAGVIADLIIDYSNVNINITGYSPILVAFMAEYILKYGYNLEAKKTKKA